LAAVLGPLGLPSQDLATTLRAAYFGFTVGGVTVSLSTLLGAGVLLVFGVIVTRAAQNWLSERFLPHTRLDAGVRNSIRTIFGYIGVVFALMISGTTLGLDLQKFALIAGALSVGIGFGLQGIVNNFVSGLILLWERGIRVGDWVVVGAEQGFVRHINARATEIETFERATLIVPNSTLVTGAVKNWMYADRIARIVVGVNVAYGTDPEQAREILIAAAKAQKLVLGIPAPLVLFSEMGDWALKFQLICFVDEALMAERVKSELNFDVYQRMREAGLKTPFPFTLPTFVGP
jgi:small-conductance mechanosensitive channel